ncbi:SH3 domain-containing protein [Alteromonas flava]|uniref:SH3 domain-containing protein n=1 Tax=Alteromonas flava TaxID=2048003 RepID=UPI000C285C53|nr:SH3 domain-containing protein [Alteromonas flava]
MKYVSRLLSLILAGMVLMISRSAVSSEYLAVTVEQPFIEMRSGPASVYPVFHVAEKGEVIEVLKTRTQWYKVRTDKGVEGWISVEDLNTTIHIDGSAVVVSSGNFADYQSRDWELGFAVGALDNVISMSASAGWVLTENLTVEANFSQALGDFAENRYWTLRILHYTFPEWRLSPYLGLGSGQISTTPRSNLVASGDESRTNDIMEVSAGLRYYLTRNMVIRLEYKSLLALTQRDEQEELSEWKLGINVFF